MPTFEILRIDGNPCDAELRSRVTQALDARELAVRQDPTNGQKWWDLGVEAQVAAGGSVQEEVGAARMLERAIMLQPRLDKTLSNEGGRKGGKEERRKGGTHWDTCMYINMCTERGREGGREREEERERENLKSSMHAMQKVNLHPKVWSPMRGSPLHFSPSSSSPRTHAPTLLSSFPSHSSSHSL